MKCISKIQSHCANMNFSDKSRHERIFQQVTHKGGDSEMKYINRFQNSQDLSVSVGNNYSEYQLMKIFLDNFHQGEKYSAQIASHQAELIIEKKFTAQNIFLFHPYRLTIYILTADHVVIKNSERENIVHTKCTFCRGANHSAEKCFKRIRKEK